MPFHIPHSSSLYKKLNNQLFNSKKKLNINSINQIEDPIAFSRRKLNLRKISYQENLVSNAVNQHKLEVSSNAQTSRKLKISNRTPNNFSHLNTPADVNLPAKHIRSTGPFCSLTKVAGNKNQDLVNRMQRYSYINSKEAIDLPNINGLGVIPAEEDIEEDETKDKCESNTLYQGIKILKP